MRLHRFFVREEIGNQSELTIHSAELVNQVRRVFRLKNGDTIIVFNGTGFDYECKIDDQNERSTIVSSKSALHLIVDSVSRSRFTSQKKIYLCAALVKKDTFEWIVEKATELGVTDIIPIQAERSEKKSLNKSRLEKIVIEASEQSGRGDVPMVHDIMGVSDAIEFLRQQDSSMLVFHTEGERFGVGHKGKEPAENSKPFGVFIGPEGGWSDSEVDLFHKNEIPLRCLGPQILRAETAVVAALSQVVFS